MFIRRGITPADKLARDSTLSRQNGLTGPLLILQEDVSGHPTYGWKQDLSAPPLFPLLELQTCLIELYVVQHDGQLSFRPIRRILLNSPAY